MPLSLNVYCGQFLDPHQLAEQMTELGYERRRGPVTCPGEFQLTGEVLAVFPQGFDGPVRIVFDDDRVSRIQSYNIKSGYTIWRHTMILIMPVHRRIESGRVFNAQEPLQPFLDIGRGDYVVHNRHGIGRFLGMERLRIQNEEKTLFVIEYQGGDRLYVPEHDLHLVQKYIHFRKKPPRLYKLGSREWSRVKAMIQKRLQKTAAELLHIQAVRASLHGHAFCADPPWMESFEAQCPFDLTPDQRKAWEEVKRDMESTAPMDRLLCGDVGFGKTEIALRASFKAVMDGKQVAVLVPTTVLAEQHFDTFSRRMRDYPIRIAMLSRFRSPEQQKKIIRDLASGTVDIVIGTHRLLSKDIAFKDIGLVIIDEEQRFGVRAKERIKHYRLLVDVLTMSATPIPRTLYMALTGTRDMSVISVPPPQRVPVRTHVQEFDERLIRRAIHREVKRGGQVFFLHNRVEDIEKIATMIKKLVPAAKVAAAHGQMPAKQLEEVMLRFFHREVDVLVCTTIIEAGLDVPTANTLIVNDAHRFGLADLHQLRGRVGRSAQQAYAYFLVPSWSWIPQEAKDRLETLSRHAELGSGFQIAYEDLQLRGAGNLLGEEQSGYIEAVGFDLYCRLLKESVDHLRQTMQGFHDEQHRPPRS